MNKLVHSEQKLNQMSKRINYTKYGEFARILRVKHHQTMTDMAKVFQVKPPFISSVEQGKKPVPATWPRIITEHYGLNVAEQQELAFAIEASRPSYRIDAQEASNKQREAAMYFSKYFNQLDDNTADKIIHILKGMGGY